MPLDEAERHEWQAMSSYDSFAWLASQLRQALEPWQRGSECQLSCPKASSQTIEAVVVYESSFPRLILAILTTTFFSPLVSGDTYF